MLVQLSFKPLIVSLELLQAQGYRLDCVKVHCLVNTAAVTVWRRPCSRKSQASVYIHTVLFQFSVAKASHCDVQLQQPGACADASVLRLLHPEDNDLQLPLSPTVHGQRRLCPRRPRGTSHLRFKQLFVHVLYSSRGPVQMSELWNTMKTIQKRVIK